MSDIERAFALAFTLVIACGGARATEPASAGSTAYQPAWDEDRATDEQPPPNSELWFGVDVYDPPEFHRDEPVLPRRAARRRAESIETYEEGECAYFPAETRARCPLNGQVARVSDVPNGVRLELRAGTNVAAVADHMRCHISFAIARGREAEDCPLYVQGAQVRDNGFILLTTDAGDDAVAEIRERVRRIVDGD